MCKVDYNTNIPKIGIKNAFKLIKEYSSIDNLIPYLESQNTDYSMLRHLRCRDIFTTFNNLKCRTCDKLFPNYGIQGSKYPACYCKKCILKLSNTTKEYIKAVNEVESVEFIKTDVIKVEIQTNHWSVNIDLPYIFEYLQSMNIKHSSEEITKAWKPCEIEFV
jgi:5'-3' exonuclease